MKERNGNFLSWDSDNIISLFYIEWNDETTRNFSNKQQLVALAATLHETQLSCKWNRRVKKINFSLIVEYRLLDYQQCSNVRCVKGWRDFVIL